MWMLGTIGNDLTPFYAPVSERESGLITDGCRSAATRVTRIANAKHTVEAVLLLLGLVRGSPQRTEKLIG